MSYYRLWLDTAKCNSTKLNGLNIISSFGCDNDFIVKLIPKVSCHHLVRIDSDNNSLMRLRVGSKDFSLSAETKLLNF